MASALVWDSENVEEEEAAVEAAPTP